MTRCHMSLRVKENDSGDFPVKSSRRCQVNDGSLAGSTCKIRREILSGELTENVLLNLNLFIEEAIDEED